MGRSTQTYDDGLDSAPNKMKDQAGQFGFQSHLAINL